MERIEVIVARSYYVKMAILSVLSLGLGAILIVFEYRRWARVLDKEGVTRMDGRRFRWADLIEKQYVHPRLKSGELGLLDHIRLVFTNGKALVFPVPLENSHEVLAFVAAAPGPSRVTSS